LSLLPSIEKRFTGRKTKGFGKKPHRVMEIQELVRKLACPYLLELTPYEPGRPIEEVARDLGLDPRRIVKLASNENPLGPSPKALAALQASLGSLHRYPDGSAYRLVGRLAQHLGVERAHLALGNGSNELIELLFHAFVRPQTHQVVTSRYSFLVYRLMAQLFGVCVSVAEEHEFHQNIEAILQAISPSTRLVFVANPNNPTGTRISTEALLELLERLPSQSLLVLDEAYYEFLEDPPPSLQWVLEGRPLVLLRTFSKAYGLAGLRIGYAVASPPIIELLHRARQPFNVNAAAQAAAEAALDDTEHMERTRQIVQEGRKLLEQSFQSLGLRFVPSSANFVLVNVGSGRAVFRRLLEKGVIVRSMESYGLPEWIRVSVGLPEELKRFLEALPKAIQSV
jgi:histidinol-phosphate aminotransferase